MYEAQVDATMTPDSNIAIINGSLCLMDKLGSKEREGRACARSSWNCGDSGPGKLFVLIGTSVQRLAAKNVTVRDSVRLLDPCRDQLKAWVPFRRISAAIAFD